MILVFRFFCHVFWPQAVSQALIEVENLLLQLLGNRKGLVIECTFNLGGHTTRWWLKKIDSEELRHRSRWRRNLVDTSHQS